MPHPQSSTHPRALEANQAGKRPVSGVNAWLMSRWAKPVVWVLWLLPLAWLVWGVLADSLGANPAEAIIRSTGDWSLRALLLALAVTPVRQALQWNGLARFRRLLGLFAFFYVCLHLLAYCWFDMGWSLSEVLADIVQRPFILVGMLAALILFLLAVTSPQAVLRAVGGKRWRILHRSVYGAGLLAILHFYWMRAAKNDTQEVLWYAAILAVLLGWRLLRHLAARSSGHKQHSRA